MFSAWVTMLYWLDFSIVLFIVMIDSAPVCTFELTKLAMLESGLVYRRRLFN